MSAITGPRSPGLVIAVVIAVLATGCAGAKTTSPTPGQGTTASTTASTPAPMTAADLAWIQAITEMHKKIDKPFMASSINMTRAKMNELGDSLRSCMRELSRIGSPSARLQPAYELVKQACRIYAKGARCFATEASVSDAAGAVIAGTPEERIARRADACGFAAEGNGSNLLGEAEARAAAIRAQFP
jgi:hypothetical protein